MFARLLQGGRGERKRRKKDDSQMKKKTAPNSSRMAELGKRVTSPSPSGKKEKKPPTSREGGKRAKGTKRKCQPFYHF